MPHRETGNRDGAISRSPAATAPPWNAGAALLVMDLHAFTREREQTFVALVSGRDKERGGSDRNTELSLKALPKLAEAIDDDQVGQTIRTLSRWVNRAEETIGLAEPLRRIPRSPGAVEPRCPWCGYLTVRWRLTTARIHCVNPGCSTEPGHDRRPTGYLEVNLSAGTAEIVWDEELSEAREDRVNE